MCAVHCVQLLHTILHRTDVIFLPLAVQTISNVSPYASQYGELRPTSRWDRSGSWGHPSLFQRVSRLGSVITARPSSIGRQPNFAALSRGRHLYSAGRPSRWALAHILVCSCVACFCCVRFSFFGTMPRDWLGRTSPTWPILHQVVMGRKTLTQSINIFN